MTWTRYLSLLGYAAVAVVTLVGFFLLLILLLTRGASKNRHKYGPENFTQAGVQNRIDVDFLPEQRAGARELLERMGALGEPNYWVGQAQFAALLLAQGNLEKLAEASDLRLLVDTRDIIVKAGLG
jgi:hypothetical protein